MFGLSMAPRKILSRLFNPLLFSQLICAEEALHGRAYIWITQKKPFTGEHIYGLRRRSPSRESIYMDYAEEALHGRAYIWITQKKPFTGEHMYGLRERSPSRESIYMDYAKTYTFNIFTYF